MGLLLTIGIKHGILHEYDNFKNKYFETLNTK